MSQTARRCADSRSRARRRARTRTATRSRAARGGRRSSGCTRARVLRRVEEHERQRQRDRDDGGNREAAQVAAVGLKALSPPAGNRTPRRRRGRSLHHKERARPAICPGAQTDPCARSTGPDRPRGRDQRRQQQRQRDDRADQVARAALHGDRRDERPDRRERDVRERQHEREPGHAPAAASARAGTARTPARRSPRAPSGTRTGAVALANSIALRSTGASRNASKPPCSRSATNRRLIASIAANSSVAVSTPAASWPAERRLVQREVEDHERGHREQHHRRHRLERAQLEQQVLAQDGERRPHVAPHRVMLKATPSRVQSRVTRTAPAACSGVELGRRPDERRAPVAQRQHEVGLGERRLRVVAGDHAGGAACAPDQRLDQLGGAPDRGWSAARRAAAGSGRCSTARATASRCTMPRLSSRTGSSARRSICTAASTSSTRCGPDPVQARVVAQVLAPGQIAVEQRLVAEQPEPAAYLPRTARQLLAEQRDACLRAPAAASRGSAAASTCRRRCARAPPASRPPAPPPRPRAARCARRSGA